MLDSAGLGFHYSSGAWIFRAVSLELSPGEIVAVLGPNAKGKTTMVKCFAGLLTPVEGSVTTTGPVAYVPQSSTTAFSFSVLDMVLMGRTRHIKRYSSPRATDRTAARDALARVGMTHLADRDYLRLSGGERQMVLIARALASESRIMILDEPASALDLRNQARVLTVLRSLADEGMGIIMTTHHPDHALHVAERSLLFVSADEVRIDDSRRLLTGETLSELYGLDIVTSDVTTPSTRRRVIVPDFGAGVVRDEIGSSD